MRLTSVSTLRAEDFVSQHSWIDKLLFPLNQFLTSVTQTINGNITFGDNIPGTTQSINFTYGGTNFPQKFKWSLANQPIEVRLCSAYEDNLPISVMFSWSYASGQINIEDVFKISSSGVSGLTVGSVYNITFRGQL